MRRHAIIVLMLALIVGCQRAPAQTANTAATPGQTKPAPQTGSTAQPVSAGQTPDAAPGAPAGTPGAPPAAKPVPPVLPDVLARVNGEPIQKGEFEKAVRNVEARVGKPVPTDQRDTVYRGVLDQLVSYHILLQESKTRNIQVTDQEVNQRLEEIKKQFPTEADFTKALASRSTTLDDLKQETRQELALTHLMDAAVKPQIKVQESDIKDFYDKNPDKFQQPESVRASHILIKTDPSATDAQKKEARAKAEEILKKVKSGGDFAALARENSQDGSAPQGGDLNFFTRGQMVPPFEQAAFTMKPGDTSDIVETQFGYHIIKVTERREARTVPLTEVSPRIEQFLSMQQQQEKTEAFISGLKSKSKIEILI